MLKRWCAYTFVFMLLGAWSNAWALSIKFGADVMFQRSFTDMDAEQRANLESFRCQVGTHSAAVVIVEGHASSDEADAKALSEQRVAGCRLG